MVCESRLATLVKIWTRSKNKVSPIAHWCKSIWAKEIWSRKTETLKIWRIWYMISLTEKGYLRLSASEKILTRILSSQQTEDISYSQMLVEMRLSAPSHRILRSFFRWTIFKWNKNIWFNKIDTALERNRDGIDGISPTVYGILFQPTLTLRVSVQQMQRFNFGKESSFRSVCDLGKAMAMSTAIEKTIWLRKDVSWTSHTWDSEKSVLFVFTNV